MICGKEIDKKTAIFQKGKFFDSKSCLKKFEEKAKSGKKSEKEVCEFC